LKELFFPWKTFFSLPSFLHYKSKSFKEVTAFSTKALMDILSFSSSSGTSELKLITKFRDNPKQRRERDSGEAT